MSSHGRGRGLRRTVDAAHEKPGGMQRPHKGNEIKHQKHPVHEDLRSAKSDESPIPDSFQVADLLELINKLTIERAEDKKADEVRRITKGIKYLCFNEESLKILVAEVHKKSLEDDEFGRKAARAIGNVSQFEVAGIKLRDVLLRNIQNDFKSKDETLSGMEQVFLNSVSLLCEVFQHVRLTDGTVINVLSVPILEYCDMLLNVASPAAISLLGRQLQVIGEEVQRCKPERFTLILLKVRQMLISHTPELSVKSKCVLLHILELHLLRWPTLLPEKTGEWYSEIIGQRVLMRRPDLAAQNQTSIKLNGHDQLKEESGLTAEDELVLQRVIQPDFQEMKLGPSPATVNQSTIPHNMHDNAMPSMPEQGYGSNPGYYESQSSRPRSNPEPGAFQTPPPGHAVYGGLANTPPPIHGRIQGPMKKGYDRPIGNEPGYPLNDRGSYRSDQVCEPENANFRRHDAGFMGTEPAFQNMKGFESNMMSQSSTFQDAARVASDMMSYRAPPARHQTSPPLRESRGQGWQAMPPNIGIPTAIVPPGVPPMTRPANSWSDGPPRPGVGKAGWTPIGRSDVPPPGRGDNGISGRSERHVGGSGRIMPTKTPPPEEGNWGGSSGRGWSSGTNGPNVAQDNSRGGGFDIGTWSNPGERQGGGGSNSGSGSGSSWEKRKEPAGGGQWDNAMASGGAWSTKDGTEARPIGTWENPDKEKPGGPERNTQVNSWGKQSGQGGNWTNNENKTPEKQTGSHWNNDMSGELSPGSAWKKEPSFIGSWADSVPSPRSDQEENPLNTSLEEKESLHRQINSQTSGGHW